MHPPPVSVAECEAELIGRKADVVCRGRYRRARVPGSGWERLAFGDTGIRNAAFKANDAKSNLGRPIGWKKLIAQKPLRRPRNRAQPPAGESADPFAHKLPLYAGAPAQGQIHASNTRHTSPSWDLICLGRTEDTDDDFRSASDRHVRFWRLIRRSARCVEPPLVTISRNAATFPV